MVSASLFEHPRFHPYRFRQRGQSIRQGRHLQAHRQKGSTRSFKAETRRLSRVWQVTDLNFVPLAFAQGLIPELQGWAFPKKRRAEMWIMAEREIACSCVIDQTRFLKSST